MSHAVEFGRQRIFCVVQPDTFFRMGARLPLIAAPELSCPEQVPRHHDGGSYVARGGCIEEFLRRHDRRVEIARQLRSGEAGHHREQPLFIAKGTAQFPCSMCRLDGLGGRVPVGRR